MSYKHTPKGLLIKEDQGRDPVGDVINRINRIVGRVFTPSNKNKDRSPAEIMADLKKSANEITDEDERYFMLWVLDRIDRRICDLIEEIDSMTMYFDGKDAEDMNELIQRLTEDLWRK